MLNKLSAATIQARKDKNGDAKLLVTFLSEVRMRAKDDGNREVTDTDIVKVAQKFMKSAKETVGILQKDDSRPDALTAALREIEVLDAYIPTLMDEDATRAAVAAAIEATGATDMSDMGRIMGELKKSHGVTINMGLASGILKTSF